MVIYSADLSDARTLTYDSLGISSAANEAEAVQKAKDWAKKRLDAVPEIAWLLVNIDGAIRSFPAKGLI
jgi:hypothetical protein